MESLPEHVSAVLVTRGDVDLSGIVASLAVDDVVIWDNSKREDFKVFGRYRAITEAKHDVIYTQDDDCIVEAAALIGQYEPGKIVCNMPQWKRREYPGRIQLVGWGACFDRSLVLRGFQRYFQRFAMDELFLREADRVFTALSETKLIDVPFEHLPHAYSDRMGNEARHLADLAEISRRIQSIQ